MYIKVLESVKKNAEYIGLDAENLEYHPCIGKPRTGPKGIFPPCNGKGNP